ncbi:MAG: HEAT repeat domain-containing protein [Scytolyngbya sp. HA4215-MV1]|jgi:HEAT repeat protein/energy-coupling factor transporter ATP-binding protein EcfA2|nr:HEAT repeat domain-containing protein [Scytolyngbya sp. HA4215-MV1]
MKFETVLQLVDDAVFQYEGRHLSDVESFILQGVWEGLTYEEMQQKSQYSFNYLTRDVGPALWKVLSQAFGEKVSKANFRSVIQRLAVNQEKAATSDDKSQASASNYVTNAELNAYRKEYLRQLTQRIDDVKFVGIAVPGEEVEKQEQLAQIFVMPTVQAESRSTSVTQVEDESDLEPADPQQRLLAEQRSWAKRDRSGRKLPAQQVLSQSKNKAVLLGAPGSGKTTLLSYFALMLGNQAQSDPTQIGFEAGADWLPLVVRIRDWVLQPKLGLLAYLRWYAEDSLSMKHLPQDFFEHWLERGRALILLDGLDEVADEAQQRKTVEQIETFLAQYDANPAVITSRPAGYRWDFFNLEAFPHYTLEPFDDDQIKAFIEHWYDSRVPDKAQAERRKADLQKALKGNDRIRQLAKNPLLLTIIVLIHRYQAELPRQRYKLYEKAVETLLTSWDSGKEIKLYEVLQYLKPDDLLYVLKKLAYWIHAQGSAEDAEGGTLIEQAELLKQLSQEICRLKNCKKHEAKKEAERFVDFVQRRTGLLNEQGRARYAFVHKTFQEYLTAEEIYDQFEEGEDEIILQHIRQYLHQQHWREVLLLLVSKLKKKRAAEAIRGIYQAGSAYEPWLHRDLLFAGWCLTEDSQGLKGADGELVAEILDGLVSLEVSDWQQIGSKVRSEAAKILHRLGETAMEADAWARLQAQADKIHPVRLAEFQASLGQEPEAIAQLLSLLKDEDASVRSRAAEALVNLGNASSAVVQALLSLLKDEASDVRYRAAAALGNLSNASSAVVQGLLSLLKDEDSDVRSRAAAALGNLGNASSAVVQGLLSLLKDEDSDVRYRAAASLVNLGNASSAVVQGLLSLLKDEDASVRSRAAEALVNLGNASLAVVQGLLDLLQDPQDYVRFRAAHSLGNLGNASSEVVQGLLGLLQDPQAYVCSRAAAALGNLGKRDETVLPVLVQWLKQCAPEDSAGDGVDALWAIVVGE